MLFFVIPSPRFAAGLCWFLGAALAGTALQGAEKLKPEEVVQKHLKAVGSDEARTAVESRVVRGIGRIEIVLGGNARMEGSAFLLSQGNKLRYVLDVGNPNYQREDFAFNGKERSVGFVTPGRYSQLGEFLNLYDDILKEGLMGGVLTTGWPLLDIKGRKPRLKYSGLKKLDDRQVHALDYSLRKGGRDLRIRLYFEEETFRHLGTDYDVRTPAAQMGPTPGSSSQVRQASFRLTERFAQFHQADGYTLPLKWNIQLSIDRGVGNRTLWEWEMVYDQISHNQPIEPGFFDVYSKSGQE